MGCIPRAGARGRRSAQFDGSKFQLAAPEPNPKYGGVLRIGITNRPPHFDLHQSGTFNNLGAMAPMFDNLIRRDPRDSGKTIIPDLAHSWEISQGQQDLHVLPAQGHPVQRRRGTDADDVKATFDRIVKPPEGISIPRSILFKAVSEVNARDKYTIEFKLAEARLADLHHGGDRQRLERHRAQEDAGGQQLQPAQGDELSPGTGPFKTVRRVENEIWVVEKNKDYWNKGLPYLDGIEFYNLIPFSPELGSGILSHRVDYGRVTRPGDLRSARRRRRRACRSRQVQPERHPWRPIPIPSSKPLDDPRVRRALHLAMDRPPLIECVKDVAPMQVGGFIYPFSDFATPKPELVKRSATRPIRPPPRRRRRR